MSTPAKLSAPNFSVPPLWCLLPDYQISLWSRSPRNFRPWKSISCPGSSLSLIYQQHLTHQITLPPSTLFPSQNPTLRATSSPKVIPLNCPPPEPPWHASPVLSLRCCVFSHPYSADAIYHPVSLFQMLPILWWPQNLHLHLQLFQLPAQSLPLGGYWAPMHASFR